MNNSPDTEYVSVRQFAEMAGVSAQRIYQRLDTNLKPFVKTLQGKKMLSVEGLQLFLKEDPAHDKPDVDKLIEEACQGLTSKLESVQAANEVLKAENSKLSSDIKELEKGIETLREKLKDNKIIIQELRADKAKLNERLDKEQETVSDLSAALKAAQLLHGMDKQQKTIEVKEVNAATQSELGVPEDQKPEPEQKRSLFARLFRKRSE